MDVAPDLGSGLSRGFFGGIGFGKSDKKEKKQSNAMTEYFSKQYFLFLKRLSEKHFHAVYITFLPEGDQGSASFGQSDHGGVLTQNVGLEPQDSF